MTERQGSGTFVGDFVRYARSRTDSPPDFHPHAALVTLSAALGNRVYCHAFGFRPIYPNLWTVILAPSGYGKSAPLDLSENLIRMAGLGERLLPTSFTQEALLGAIEKAETGAVLYAQEFSALLAMMGRDYNAGCMQVLTELYDVPVEYDRILMKSVVKLQRPFISILGASSPEWFAETFKGNMLRGGFLARFMFCPSREAGPYVGLAGTRDSAVEAPLAHHLKLLTELSGEVSLNKVLREYNAWDRDYRENVRKDCPPEFSGMRSRAGALVLKTAMLFHFSHDPQTLELCPRDLALAIQFVTASQDRAERYLSEEVAHNPDDVDRLRILEIIRRNAGRVLWGKALKDSHLSAFKFKNAIETLEQSDRVRLESGGGKARYIVERLPLSLVEAGA